MRERERERERERIKNWILNSINDIAKIENSVFKILF
jgi:hypothetical protein